VLLSFACCCGFIFVSFYFSNFFFFFSFSESNLVFEWKLRNWADFGCECGCVSHRN
jgi:hypothetical protein